MAEEKKSARESIQQAKDTIGQRLDDIKASTDSSVLGVARFLGLLYGPIDRRLRVDQALKKALDYRLSPHAGWRHAFGGVTYLLFIVQVVTGVLMSFYYRPSAAEAYHSLQHIVTQVPFGWLVRDLHYWGANLLLVAILIHMARAFYDATYKPPRETNWLIGVFLLGLVLAFGASGVLLPWDQWAYWTATEILAWVEVFPVFGGLAAEFLTGDAVVSGATLSRYFALHVVLLPWVALALLSYHFVLVRRLGIAPRADGKAKEEGVRFYPHHLLRSFVVSLVVLAIVFSLASLFPRPFAPIADPGAVPVSVNPTWGFTSVSFTAIRFLGGWGLPAGVLLGLALILLPIMDRNPDLRPRRRLGMLFVGFGLFAAFAASWVVGSGPQVLPGVSQIEEVAETDAPDENPIRLPEVGPTTPAAAPATGDGER